MSLSNHCTVLMYHYVRDFSKSAYPDIKGLDFKLFLEQIAFLEKHYNFVRIEDVIDAYNNGTRLAPNAVLLTFDDGYRDHYEYVYPILAEKNIQGCFYIPVTTATENKILDVNKIHYILAACDDKSALIETIYRQLDAFRSTYELESNEHYFQKLAVANRFDPKEVIFIKRLLQVELPEALRNQLTDLLFREYVSSDEAAFSRELYMNVAEITEMQANGMHIGAHGHQHYWLGSLTKAQQSHEIQQSMQFIQAVGGDLQNWTMCYPYGNYNTETLEILRENNCQLAFTTQVEILNTSRHDRLTVPRLDTNDLPKDRNAIPNHWYLRE